VRALESEQPFSQNESIYLRLGLRESAVKTRFLAKEDSDLTLEFPTQVALEEGRKKTAIIFTLLKEKLHRSEPQWIAFAAMSADLTK